MTYNRYKYLPLFVVLFVIASCDNLSISEQKGEQVRIQVDNASSFTMDNIQVFFPDKMVNYGSLDPGETSAFELLPKAYRYQSVEMLVNGVKALHQPIDFVGEEFLPKGDYTYKLTIDEEIFESNPERSVFIELEKIEG